MEEGPGASGYLFGYWTVGTVAAHLTQHCRLVLSRTTVRTLHALDFRWRRPRHALPIDPHAASTMWQLCHQLLHAPAEAVILTLDECDVQLLPVLRACWMRRGHQRRIPTPGSNRKRTVFGALDPASGRWLYQIHARKRAVEFLAFLEHLSATYPDHSLLLILDNASIHTAKVVQAWLAEHPEVQLLYLPTYSGHEHNPVEKVWWRLKDQIAANRLQGSMETLVEAVHEFFDSFTPEDALRLAA